MGSARAILHEQPAVTDPDPRRSLVAVVDRATAEVTVISGADTDPRAQVLVRDGRRTCALVTLDGAGEAAERGSAAHPDPAPLRGWQDGAGRDLAATVVVCTLGRNPLLRVTVAALLAQTHRRVEIIIVDNDPASGATRQLLDDHRDPRLRIVDEPHPGLSRARNAGVAAATGEIIAFTDDDALPHPSWLASLLDVFASAPPGEVGAVTGPAFAAELQSRSQRFFEARGGFPKQLEPVVWSLDDPSPQCARFGARGEGGPLFPVATARVGAGVSMAFSRPALAALGDFDVRLGAGTLTNGGEDLDAFARVLRAGLAIIYNPDAVVHHVHRRDMAGLEKQIHGNGTGMAALLTVSLLRRPKDLVVLLRRVPSILSRVAPGTERMQGNEDDVPGTLSHQEIRGFLRGPMLLIREILRQRRAPERPT
ncbi:MAG: glycosyltransferase [Corynebacterium sp.]|uniref:glycosyltransferase family 2 protein n=1 Tax=Corynebacterium sp. TaxID=1720 RepID=UPI0026E03FC1|nr:glycosyltransferase family 2 protein [Corynebacterium sp.]MDO5670283.1 glycosyltransferase [Corynebacterium sp.]